MSKLDVALMTLAVGTVALVAWTAFSPSQRALRVCQNHTYFIRDCAKHRPLEACKADASELYACEVER